MKFLENSDQLLCLLADDYPSPGRPVYVFVEQLVNAMVDLGVRVEVIAPQSIIRSAIRHISILKKREAYTSKKGNIYYVNRPKIFTFGRYRLFTCLFSIFNKKIIERTLRMINPTVLYGHFWHNALKVLDYARETKVPLFVACGEGDNALEELNQTLSSDRRRELASSIKGVISVSTENKRKCIEYSLADESSITVLPNCVDDSLFKPLDNTERKELLGIKASDFVIAFVGAFINRKGSMVLSDAIDSLDDKDIKVIFIGRPLDGDDYSPKCKGIVFKGLVEHDLIPLYLNCADIFVLPTRKEGCSNAIVEALACGLPVISSDRSFNYDVLNSNNSLLIDPNSVEELAASIKLLKENKLLLNQMKDYTILHSKDYSIITRAKRIISFINSKLE